MVRYMYIFNILSVITESVDIVLAYCYRQFVHSCTYMYVCTVYSQDLFIVVLV